MAIAQSKIAGAGRRTIGGLIDLILLGIVYGVLVFYLGTTKVEGASLEVSLDGMPGLIFFAITLAYYIILEATTGRTLGKLAMGLRVVNNNQESITWGQSLIRNLLRIIDGLIPIYLIGFIVMVASPNKQRVGDHAAKTYVIKVETQK